jgi:hypothetical protein
MSTARTGLVVVVVVVPFEDDIAVCCFMNMLMGMGTDMGNWDVSVYVYG